MEEKILVVDDEESIRFTFQHFLSEAGYTTATAENYDEALRLFEGTDFDLIFIDIILDGKTGIDLLRSIRNINPNCQVVIITGAPTVETAAEGLRLGALDYIVKPVRQETLLRVSGMALRHKAVVDANERYRLNTEAIFRSVKDGIISVDREMRVIEMNDAACHLCRINRDKALREPFPALAFQCGGGCLGPIGETLNQKKTIDLTRLDCRSMARPDQVVDITASPLLNRHNKFTGGVMVIRDQTHVLQLERSLKEGQEFERMIGNSESMQNVFALIRNVAHVQTPVIIIGESGTGKELVADAIHALGDRCNNPLVKVNCSALTESLLESELFGHVRGAFTGASKDKIGRFQRADGGTIFLDEIGDVSAGMQTRFLRVLEQMEIERVGDSTPIKIDVRVIAATNQDLQGKVERGEFRQDLYYRLKVVEIRLPPLRERPQDIPLLMNHFRAIFNKKFSKNVEAASSTVQDLFMSYSWPGNVRELKNTMEHAFVVSNRSVITVDDLPPDFFKNRKGASPPSGHGDDVMAQRIVQALEQASGNKTRAAKLLGISRRTLYRKIDQNKNTSKTT